MTGVESIEPALLEAPLPTQDRGRGGLEMPFDGVEGCALRQQQDQFGAKHVSGGQRTGLGNAAEVGVLLPGEQDLAASSHDCLDATRLVMVTLRQATSMGGWISQSLSQPLIAILLAAAAAAADPVLLLKIDARTKSGNDPGLERVSVFKADQAVFYRLPLMNIDLDGSPNAYHPPVAGHPHGKGPGLGLEDLRNASSNLKDGPTAVWVGIVTDSAGKPVVQKEGPFSGFYVSQTTLEDSTFPKNDPRRYVDATTIPYVVLNPKLRKNGGLNVGDLAVVVLGREQPKIGFGIVADIGPGNGLGECSQALAASVGIPSGTENADLIYIYFATPTNRRVRTVEEIHNQADALFTAWGGISRVHDMRVFLETH